MATTATTTTSWLLRPDANNVNATGGKHHRSRPHGDGGHVVVDQDHFQVFSSTLAMKKTATLNPDVFFSRFNDGVDNFFGTDTDADVEISPIEVFPAKVSSLLNSALPLNNSSGNK